MNLSILEMIEYFPIKYPRNYSLLSYGYEKDTNPLEIVFSVCNERIIRKFANLNSDSNLPLGFKPGEFYYKGQTTNFLKNSEIKDEILITQISNCFEFPLDNYLKESKPIIYICNGTGIAPLISFLKQILSLISSSTSELNLGQIIILTGFRSASADRKETVYEDFIFSCIEKINSLFNREIIIYHRCTSCSSDNEEEEVGIWRSCRINTLYVQDLIIENEDEIYDNLVKREGYLMICGDIEKLYDECVNNIMTVLMSKEKKPREVCVKFIEEMKINGRVIIEKWT